MDAEQPFASLTAPACTCSTHCRSRCVPYFWFTCSTGKLSGVYMPSSATAGAARQTNRFIRKIVFRRIVSLRRSCGFAILVGEQIDQVAGDWREPRHLPFDVAHKSVGIHVLPTLSRQDNGGVLRRIAKCA